MAAYKDCSDPKGAELKRRIEGIEAGGVEARQAAMLLLLKAEYQRICVDKEAPYNSIQDFISLDNLAGLSQEDARKQIKKSYYRACLKYHPDKVSSRASEYDKGLANSIIQGMNALYEKYNLQRGSTSALLIYILFKWHSSNGRSLYEDYEGFCWQNYWRKCR